MAIRRWNLNFADKKTIAECSQKWNTPEICSAILYKRGFRDPKEVYEFLNCSDDLNPFEFKDMKKATNFLKEAIANSQKICIYGDYDADGITSTALLYSYFKKKTENIIYYIPNRDKEGYGLNCGAVRQLFDMGVKVLVTVDNGVSAYEEIKYANSLGMKVIITDHHKLPEKLPEAVAIINPCGELWYDKSRSFCGAGVAYKLVEAMENADEYLDFAILGTIGDSMPLIGQSRVIVKKGLKSIADSNILGIKTIFNKLNLNCNPVDAIDLAYKLIPRINASGRMKSADIALKLLTSNSIEECSEICDCLDNLNMQRKQTEEEILLAVEEKIRQDVFKKFQKIIIVEGENWHHGVIGIVASRITQKYGKPCILISYSKKDGLSRGSCRSVEGFSIYNVISSCSRYLDRFGGHTMAAGINLKIDNIKKFSDAILDECKNYDIDYPIIDVDAQLEENLISLKTLDCLECLKPFGNENPEPIFLVKSLTLKKITPIGNKNHLKLTFKGTNQIEMFYFNKSQEKFLYKEGEKVDVLITIHSNIYRSKRSVSLYIVDMKFSDVDLDKVVECKKLYEKFKRNEVLEKSEIDLLLPNREEFIRVYKFLKTVKWSRVDIISQKVFKDSIYCGKVYVILDVLENMKLIKLDYESDKFEVTINKCNKKVNLQESDTLFSLNKMKGVNLYE